MARLQLMIDLLARPRRYRYGPHRSQRADLHLPPTPGPHPVAVVIHGGSWRQRYGKIVTRPLAVDLVRHGWAAWNIEYRRVGPGGAGGGWPATFEDVADAIDRLADVDAALSLERAVVVGHSAGGHLALWAAGRDRLPAAAPGGPPRVRFSAAVSLAGVNDLAGAYADRPNGGAVAALLGCAPGERPDRYALADPIRQVPIEPAVLLVHGTDDETVSIARSRNYARAAVAAGATLTLVEIPGPAGAHRRLIDPASEGWRVARDWLAPWRHQAASPTASQAPVGRA